MAENGSIPEKQRCKRRDGRGWRCKLEVMEGKGYCEAQGVLRNNKQPVPDYLKLERARNTQPKLEPQEEYNDGGIIDFTIRKKRSNFKRVRREEVISLSLNSVPLKITKKEVHEIEGGGSVPKGQICSKKVESDQKNTAVKRLPSRKENVEASAKKTSEKCHWCNYSGNRTFVKCSTCKKQFFCEVCIDKRFHCKVTIKRVCPVCLGECSCRACRRGKRKEDITKEPVINDVEGNIIIGDSEEELNVFNLEKKFEKSQQLHMIRELLPVMEKINQEMTIELDFEAKSKGISHDQLHVQFARFPQKKECSFCKACIADVHRSCSSCTYILCLRCCQDFRDGGFKNLENTKMLRTKKSITISGNFCSDGGCPPKNFGGCDKGLLNLTSFLPFCLTKNLCETAQQLLYDCKFKNAYELSASSPCFMCDGNDNLGNAKVGNLIQSTGLRFSSKQDYVDRKLEHFMNHWVKGQPVVIPGVLQHQPDLSWDFGYMFYEYLVESLKSRNDTESWTCKCKSDWCEVESGRKQILSGGTTHDNVWNEFLKFKLWLSSSFLQEHFPIYFNAVIQALPIQEYMNPFTGSLNIAANLRDEATNPKLGFYVSISYDGLENPVDADLLSNLCCNAKDVVNVLVHATEHRIKERVLNKVRNLMIIYNSQDHLKFSKKIAKRNKLEEMFATSSGLMDTQNSEVDLTSSSLEKTRNHEDVLVSHDSSDEESDDEESQDKESDDEESEDKKSHDKDVSRAINNYGAQWDIFRREDAPKLLEYLRKYSDMLSRSYNSPKKVVHPLFDEIFYLNDYHKRRLKEEFDVEAYSFEQDIGEAVIIPAGCPYQIKKIKSCVNVVLEFISPESASECIKVSDELRLLPVNHKAKVNMVQVKEMVIHRMQTTFKEMCEVSQTELALSWPFVIFQLARPPSKCSRKNKR